MQFFLNNLKFHKPLFKINTAQIEILKDPVDFYVHLHKGIKQSQKRIVWSTLYIGNGNMEDFLVESLANQQRKFEQLRISILMDFYRGTRKERYTRESSLEHYQYLKMGNVLQHNMKLGFLRHPLLPSMANWFIENPAREVFNVHHMKWYIFDNKVILTGANLQEQYFTNRQDRYMVFHETEEIADYLDDAQSTLQNHSYHFDYDQHFQYDKLRNPPTSRGKYFKELNQSWKMFKFSYSEGAEAKDNESDFGKEEGIAQSEEKIEKENEEEEALTEEELLQYYQRDLIVEEKIQERKEQAQEILSKSFNKGEVQNIITRLEKALYREEPKDLDEGEDCYILITLHLPYLETDDDKKVFTKILDNLDQFRCITWASGYMNFTKSVIKYVNNTTTDIKFITASPAANGFHKAGKAKSLIPFFYRYFELNINKPIFEYTRPGWTFHTKGFWGELNDDSVMTIIGSSNYAVRSEKRDNEIQAYIFTQCPMFKQELKKEQNWLLENSQQITREQIQNDPEIKLTWKIKLLSKIFKSML